MTVRFIQADVFDGLAQLPSDSVHCCVTSVPYWGLRSYLPGGHPDKHLEIGHEKTLDEHIAVMLRVFREVRRVLRKDGVLWLNYGDAYCGGGGFAPNAPSTATSKSGQYGSKGALPIGGNRAKTGFKPKDLMMLPARVAIALQEDGWWLRADCIWHKSNPMPESAKDRPTSAHEHVFLLTKSARYFYDFEAVSEPASGTAHARGNGVNPKARAYDPGPGIGGLATGRDHSASGHNITGREPSHGDLNKRIKIPGAWDTGFGAHGTINRQGRTSAQYNLRKNDSTNTSHVPGASPHTGLHKAGTPRGGRPRQNASFSSAVNELVETRTMRNVWSHATEPFSGAHFAVMPSAIAERCIKAGCPAGGTVLDPFGGAGTTALAADRLGRHAILIELSEEYCAMAEKRIARDRLKRRQGSMTDVAAAKLPPTPLEALMAGNL